MSDLRLSVVVPAFNEALNLPELIEEIEEALTGGGLEWEVLIVDDASTDRTRETLAGLRVTRRWLRVIALSRNSGQSAALDAGIRAARGELVATLDADLQNDPADLPRLLESLTSNDVDMVIGIRVHRHDSFARRIQSRIGNSVRDWITGDRVTDTGCSLKLFRRQCFERVSPFRGMHRFLPTLARIQGYRVIELPVNHRPRRYGVSKYGVMNRALGGLADCFAVRWMSRRAVRYEAREIETAT